MGSTSLSSYKEAKYIRPCLYTTHWPAPNNTGGYMERGDISMMSQGIRQNLSIEGTALWRWTTAYHKYCTFSESCSQQSNGRIGARMSGKGGEWKDLSSGLYYQIHLVPVKKCKRRSRVLPPNLPDTATTSQDGSSPEIYYHHRG